jgi:N utilization substance protein A
MTNKDFFLALEELEQTNGISKQTAMEWLKNSLIVAYKKNSGEGRDILFKIDEEKKTIKMYAIRTIVADDEVEDPEMQISLSEAKTIKKSFKIGDVVKEEITPKEFGRIAAGAAKQVFTQKFRDYLNNPTTSTAKYWIDHHCPRCACVLCRDGKKLYCSNDFCTFEKTDS